MELLESEAALKRQMRSAYKEFQEFRFAPGFVPHHLHLPQVCRNFRRFRYGASNRAVPYWMYGCTHESQKQQPVLAGLLPAPAVFSEQRSRRRAQPRRAIKETTLIPVSPMKVWALPVLRNCIVHLLHQGVHKQSNRDEAFVRG